MDKQDWIEVLEKLQKKNMGWRALTPDQREAITKTTESLRSAVCSLSDGFDLTLEDCRALEASMWSMHHAFEHLEPTEYQLDEIEAHNLEWDYDAHAWHDAAPDAETLDDWEPHGV